MGTAALAILGLVGALARDTLEVIGVIRARRAGFPMEWRSTSFVAGSLIRVASGGLLAGVLAATDQINGPFGALLIGAIAPILLSRLVEFLSPDSTS